MMLVIYLENEIQYNQVILISREKVKYVATSCLYVKNVFMMLVIY